MNRKLQVALAGAAALAGICVASRVLVKRCKIVADDISSAAAMAENEKGLPHSVETVQAASEDSFPASDPPAWTGTTGTTW
jgi:hypothetical protein